MMEVEVFNQPDPRDLKISAEMSNMEIIYGGEYNAAKMCPLYFYNKFLTVNGNKVSPMTQQEWNQKPQLIIKARRKS